MTDFRTGTGCKELRREEETPRGANGDRLWLEADRDDNWAAGFGPGAEEGDTERERNERWCGRDGVDVLPLVNRRPPLFNILGSSVPRG